MTPKMIWANVAVNDVERTKQFYTALGFKPNGSNTSKDLASFLMGENQFIIHFFVKEILQTSMKGEMVDPQKANEIMFTLSATSKELVDSWAKEIEAAGGKLVTTPEVFGEGYYGFVFADPDGHKFNVFYMEGL